MAHQRKLIRHQVVAQLLGQTSAGTRVEATRKDPYRLVELPAIAVYTVDEDVDQERSITAPRELTRDLKLEIAAWVAPGDDVDDKMDDLAEQIETAMDADIYLGDTAAYCVLRNTTMGLRGEAAKTMGLITLTYAVTYRTLSPKAPTLTDDFLRNDAKQKIVGITDPTQAAEDLFNVRNS